MLNTEGKHQVLDADPQNQRAFLQTHNCAPASYALELQGMPHFEIAATLCLDPPKCRWEVELSFVVAHKKKFWSFTANQCCIILLYNRGR